MTLRQRLRLAAGAAALLAGAAAPATAQQGGGEPQRVDAARLMNELMTGKGPIGAPFSLPDQNGRRVGPAQWKGRVVLLYFGYTFCPDACPTDLYNIAEAIAALGPDGELVQPVFVTLDPERDTPARIGAYAQHFHPRFAALSGSAAEIRAVALSYKVFYEKVPLGGSDQYAIDHTSFTYVLDTQGRYAGYFPPGTKGSRMAEQVRVMLSRSP